MNKFLATALALGLGATLAPAAQAQDWRGRDGWRDRDSHYERDRDRGRHDRHDRRGAKHWGGRPDWRHDSRWDRGRDRDWDHRWDRGWDADRYRYQHRRYRAPSRYIHPRGWYSYRWSVGHRLPPAWYGRSYYVDHRIYDLAPPPYGYRWVRVDDDVFLVALASGLISHAIHDLFRDIAESGVRHELS